MDRVGRGEQKVFTVMAQPQVGSSLQPNVLVEDIEMSPPAPVWWAIEQHLRSRSGKGLERSDEVELTEQGRQALHRIEPLALPKPPDLTAATATNHLDPGHRYRYVKACLCLHS